MNKLEINKEKEINKLLIEKSLLEKDLEYKEIELLRSRGLFTGRGIFEFYLTQAGFELKSPNATKGLDITSTCNKIDEILECKPEQKVSFSLKNYTSKIYEIAFNCKVSTGIEGDKILSKLYRKLSNSVHGHPWYGNSVMIYSKDLNPIDSCLLVTLCEKMNLTTQFSENPLL
jgi:hypothetical protein